MKTSVVFLIFNRPNTTERVFELIRQAKPPKLLVVADGPRADRTGEAERCAAARAIIDRVDWECDVLKNYSDINLGCRNRISSGLDWVFETVEEAIILEDDCLPHLTFFRFCEELLEYYRQDTRIMHIAGNSFGISSTNPNESYYISKLTSVWGWATWRRAWRYYDVNMSLWPDLIQQNRLLDVITSKEEANLRYKNWNRAYTGEVDSWAYQWFFACVCQGGHAVVPNKNLVTNIGFSSDATHTADSYSSLANLKAYELKFPLIHPKFLIKSSYVDQLYFKKVYSSQLTSRLKNKFRKLLSLIYKG